MDWTGYFWLAMLVFFIAVEAGTVTVVSIWFAGGALGAIIASLLGAQFWLQVVIFIGVSALLLACLRPFVKKYLNPKITKTNVDSVIGMQGIVCEEIDNIKATGAVKLGAMEWSARSVSGAPIPAGTQVVVQRIEGVKVFVSEAEVFAVK